MLNDDPNEEPLKAGALKEQVQAILAGPVA
jgi:hypothetical protein